VNRRPDAVLVGVEDFEKKLKSLNIGTLPAPVETQGFVEFDTDGGWPTYGDTIKLDYIIRFLVGPVNHPAAVRADQESSYVSTGGKNGIQSNSGAPPLTRRCKAY
jgi:hypothetical protein